MCQDINTPLVLYYQNIEEIAEGQTKVILESVLVVIILTTSFDRHETLLLNYQRGLERWDRKTVLFFSCETHENRKIKEILYLLSIDWIQSVWNVLVFVVHLLFTQFYHYIWISLEWDKWIRKKTNEIMNSFKRMTMAKIEKYKGIDGNLRIKQCLGLQGMSEVSRS